MSTNEFVPIPSMVLTDDGRIRAYIHPTRMTILEILGREKQTSSGIAHLLGVHPANLTHHIKLLEKTGLIKLVEKRDTGKNLEKYYRAIARHYSVNLSGKPMTNKKVLALSIVHDDLTAAIKTLGDQDAGQAVFGLLKRLVLNPGDVVKFQQRLMKLLEEFERRKTKDGVAYNVNISFYPGEPGQSSTQEVLIRGDD